MPEDRLDRTTDYRPIPSEHHHHPPRPRRPDTLALLRLTRGDFRKPMITEPEGNPHDDA